MSSSLQKALSIIRERTNNDTELGTAFENLTKVFLENDDIQKQEYEEVWHYSDWAKKRPDYNAKDIGIDLVAKLRDGSGFCAIQCKFYSPDHSISKADLDSFISASATADFVRLLLVDTTTKDISKNAQSVFDNLEKDYLRIPLSELDKSRINWATYVSEDEIRLYSKKELRDDQQQALDAVCKGLTEADRGKLIMACGTGKTFISLKIAEKIAGKGKLVLFMVPSLALMSQAVREWKNDSLEDFTAFSACSDTKIGQKKSNSDQIIISLHDLAFPATTDASEIAEKVSVADKTKMTVIFSTYHSIDVITKAQKEHGLPEFDLIICDEAHRTTGETLSDEDDSNFVKIHSNENIIGKKRLYMTATPRIYGERAKSKAKDHDITLASMDDESIYGEVLFFMGFSWAVENNLLSDYKVIVLAIDEGIVSANVQKRLAEGLELKLDDATKIIGCYKALTKKRFDNKKNGEESKSQPPMKRALGFCQNIAVSKLFESEFVKVVEEYLANESSDGDDSPRLEVEVKHVDGTFNAKRRDDRLDWLRDDDVDDNNCRILTNVRCLSEGVDVPALDAILFLHPRKSQIDVVQAVGRVMRKTDEKDMGYIILPVAIPPNTPADIALNDNERYRVVWQILNALRAHDERFDSTINRIALGEDISDKIEIIGLGASEEVEAVTAIVDDIKTDKYEKKKEDDEEDIELGDEKDEPAETEGQQLSFVLSDLSQAIKAKIVEKCGTRDYWEDWANDIAKIAQTHIIRISTIVAKEGCAEKAAFEAFLEEIRDDLNPEISEEDAIEMLAQHLITRPVFDTLFQDHQFTKENPVSKAMEIVLDELHEHHIEKEAESLKNFYESVRRRAADIATSRGRQNLIVELYDKFFRNAFPATTQKLGIVYTPVEIVDFILNSVNEILVDDFGISLGSKGVHIIDPFCGTGTFITRLLQSGLIKKEALKYKYNNEIHANDIVLLAYYIANINIESVYQELAEEADYQPFNGMVLTDTFQLHEQEKDMIANLLPDNSKRRTAQKERDIRIIMANPPYSAGQRSANDNAANISYLNLDKSIEETYADASSATNKNSLYDSYIRAFRWASDRIGNQGIIGFVTGAGWIDGSATDGFRKCLAEEFTSIYIFNLRGNARTKGELRRKEKGNVFGSGSRAPIAISILVKNPKSSEQGKIYFHDIGDYLDRETKLSKVKEFGSINGITNANGWKELTPDEDNDWLNQGDKKFQKYISIGSKKEKSSTNIFENYSRGIATCRDAWCYNSSAASLKNNIKQTINFYTSEVQRLKNKNSDISNANITNLLNKDSNKISWSDGLINNLVRGKEINYLETYCVISCYRPFTKLWLYNDKRLIERTYQIPKIFPSDQIENKVIVVTGVGAGSEFSTLMSGVMPNLHTLNTCQCFPLKLYEKPSIDGGLFANEEEKAGYQEKDGISNEGLKHFQDAYQNETITKEELFYYIYGFLHSPGYRDRFQNNLSKELPRIPAVKKYEDFKTFSDAGRRLGELHINYEQVEPYLVTFKEGDLRLANIEDPEEFYRVKKMKFHGSGKNKDKTIVIYNSNITITNIPLDAYSYIVNGRPALEWVMERQGIKKDKASGIVNDANDYANETMNNPAYPLELFQRVITVSLETMEIVRALPKLDIS